MEQSQTHDSENPLGYVRISDEHLCVLIAGLTGFKEAGVIDPWLLSDGSVIEPLDILLELRALRRQPQIIAVLGAQDAAL